MEAWRGQFPVCPFKRGQRRRSCLFIGVRAGKISGCKGFLPAFPQTCPINFWATSLQIFSHKDQWIRFLELPPKILFMCFFANLGASLWSQATLDAIFSRIFRVYSKSKLFGVRSPPCTSTSNNTAFHNSIVGNFVVYQDRLETNLLQLFGHPEDSKWFSVISVIIFPVNIVDEQKQT